MESCLLFHSKVWHIRFPYICSGNLNGTFEATAFITTEQALNSIFALPGGRGEEKRKRYKHIMENMSRNYILPVMIHLKHSTPSRLIQLLVLNCLQSLMIQLMWVLGQKGMVGN
jgi:fructose/tagatose bisphosphate aldolase